MDTLRVEDFSFDEGITVKAKVAYWRKKKLWYFMIKESPENPGYFTAVSDKGRYIAKSDGAPVHFKTEEDAMRTALQYNNDMVKIRQGACAAWEKNKTGPHYVYL